MKATVSPVQLRLAELADATPGVRYNRAQVRSLMSQRMRAMSGAARADTLDPIVSVTVRPRVLLGYQQVDDRAAAERAVRDRLARPGISLAFDWEASSSRDARGGATIFTRAGRRVTSDDYRHVQIMGAVVAALSDEAYLPLPRAS